MKYNIMFQGCNSSCSIAILYFLCYHGLWQGFECLWVRTYVPLASFYPWDLGPSSLVQ